MNKTKGVKQMELFSFPFIFRISFYDQFIFVIYRYVIAIKSQSITCRRQEKLARF